MRTRLSTPRRRPRNRTFVGACGLALGATFALTPVVAADAPKPPLVATVTRVNDGDSIEVKLDSGAGRVRLSAIDTPEHDQPHGDRASAALKALLPIGATVQLDVVTQDNFRRIVAVVWLVSGSERVNVNEKMLRDGHAWAYRRYARDARFCDLEAEARAAKRGLWAQPVSDWVYPPEWRFLENGEIRALPTPSVETRETCVAVLKKAGAATYTPPN
jgi:endonuclease YncB( thermonuclease family)